MSWMNRTVAVCLCVGLLGVATASDADEDAIGTRGWVQRVCDAASVHREVWAVLSGDVTGNIDAIGMPLTAAVLSTQVRSGDDMTWLTRTHRDILAAMDPVDVRGGRKHRRHERPSLIHPEYVHSTSVAVSGDTAQGEVLFRAPDTYEGRARFEAERKAGAWTIVSLSLPGRGVRVVRTDGRWQLASPAEGAPKSESAAPDKPRPLGGKPTIRVNLPVVSQVSAPPVYAKSVQILASADGYVRLAGSDAPQSLGALTRRLRELSRGKEEPDGASSLDVVLQVDRTVPWVLSQWLMMSCATARVYRIHFAAVTPAGKGGVLSTFLPKDRGLHPTPAFPEVFAKIKVKVLSARDGQPADLAALYEILKKRYAALEKAGETKNLRHELVAPPPRGGAVPHHFMLKIVDVMLRAGAKDVIFEGAAMPRRSQILEDPHLLAAHVRKLQANPTVPRLRVGHRIDVPRIADGAQTWPTSAPAGETRRADSAIATEVFEEELEETIEEVIEEPVIKDEEIIEEPVIKDEEVREEAFEEEEGLKDAPFDRPDDNTPIGIGGGAGGAFREGRGSSERTEEAFEDAQDKALRWLAAHQSPNGGWEAANFGRWCNGEPTEQPSDGAGKAHYDVGVTGLTLSAFLGAGYTNRGKHPFAKVVSRGLRYLKNVQDPEGCFGPRSTQQYIYNHAMGALAMVEAYGMTGSPIFKGSAQRALDFIAQARNPYFAWRYGIRPGDNDTSVSTWMCLVLQSAARVNEDAKRRGRPAPLRIDEAAADGMRAWLEKATGEGGRVGYVARGSGSSRSQQMMKRFPHDKTEALTAAAATIRMLYLGEDPRNHEALRNGLERVRALPPRWLKDGSIDLVYWHWGGLAAFQAGGKTWETWKAALEKALVPTQRTDGGPCGLEGSWDPRGAWGAEGGRVYATAILALVAGSHFRYDRRLR